MIIVDLLDRIHGGGIVAVIVIALLLKELILRFGASETAGRLEGSTFPHKPPRQRQLGLA